MNPFPVLVVDDEDIMRNALVDTLRDRGFEVDAARSGEEALARLDREAFALVLTDLRMPGIDGLELLRRVRASAPETEVVLMTAYGTVENAVEAMKLGAGDYITKPFDFNQIEAVLLRIREKTALVRENRRLKAELRERHGFDRMIGKSEPMQKIYDLVERIAASPATVLVTGESGTGKELIAGAIHYAGPRRKKPLVKLNCAAMPETLLESELFGHEKGSFTGALGRKPGHFETADGGTLFLDEVGEIPLSTQVKLLRAIQEKTFNRVGGVEAIKVDVRIVAATNADLEEAIKAGKFRTDLYFRLNVIPIHVPPLRERREDIPLLADHFLRRFAKENGRAFRSIDREAMKRLVESPWPGNVRELMNVVERTVVLNDGEALTPAMLPAELAAPPGAAAAGHATAAGPDSPLREVERLHIRRVLDHVDWNLARAARVLEIDRKTLYAKIERYDLARGRALPPEGPR